MAFKLSLWFRGEELCSREDPTEDDIIAIHNCRQFAAEVAPALRQAARADKKFAHFKRLEEGDLEKRTTRIELQLTLSLASTNGRHG